MSEDQVKRHPELSAEIDRLNDLLRYEREMWREAMDQRDQALSELEEIRAEMEEVKSTCRRLTSALMTDKRNTTP